MDRLHEIEQTLDSLHKEFNEQVVALSADRREFHDSLIELTSKYPEHKELIQFIVLVNDKLETNQHTFGEIVVESFNDLIKTKKTLVKEIIDSKDNVNNRIDHYHGKQKLTIMERIKNIRVTDVKTILLYTAIIVLVIGVLMDATLVAKLITLIKGVF